MFRHVFRAMMAGIFIYTGAEAVRRPAPKADQAEDVVNSVAEPLALPSEDPEDLVRLGGAVQVGAGGMLLLNLAPRFASAVLATSLVPTTAVDHRFWEEADEKERKSQLLHFLKNLALVGGLAITSMDTQGKPGVAWRASHAADHAAAEARWRKREAELLAEIARHKSRAALASTEASTVAPARQATKDARVAGKTAAKGAKVIGRGAARTAQSVGRSTAKAVGAVGSGAGKAVKAVSS